MGLRSLDDLVGEDAEALYERLCVQLNARVDRCMLYVFRCAIYFATEDEHRHKQYLINPNPLKMRRLHLHVPWY